MSRLPPIPISSEVGDDFSREHGRDVVIFMDGNQVIDVQSFDREKGEIVRIKRDPSTGERMLKRGDVVRETIKGKVEVLWRAGLKPKP